MSRLGVGALLVAAISTSRTARAHGDIEEHQAERHEASDATPAELPVIAGERAPIGYHLESRRNGEWLAGGILLLGVAYGVGVFVGSERCPNAGACWGAWPYVPVIGPIGGAFAATGGSTGARVGAVVDGLAQAGALYFMVRGLTVRQVWARDGGKLALGVAPLAAGAPGVSLIGTF